MKRQKKLLTMVAVVAMFVFIFGFNATANAGWAGAQNAASNANNANPNGEWQPKNGYGLGFKLLEKGWQKIKESGNAKELRTQALKNAENKAVEYTQKQGNALEFKDNGFIDERPVNGKSLLRLNLGTHNGQDVIIVMAITVGDSPAFLAYKAFTKIEAVKSAPTEKLYDTFDGYAKSLIGPLAIQTSAITPDDQR